MRIEKLAALNAARYFMEGAKHFESEGKDDESRVYSELSLLAKTTAELENEQLFLFMSTLLFMFQSKNDILLAKMKELTNLALLIMIEDLSEEGG